MGCPLRGPTRAEGRSVPCPGDDASRARGAYVLGRVAHADERALGEAQAGFVGRALVQSFEAPRHLLQTGLDAVPLEQAVGELPVVVGRAGALRGRDLAELEPDAERARRFEAGAPKQVRFIFQQFHLIPYSSALENVMLAQYIHSLADEDEAAAAVHEVGLGERLRDLPSELSGGE